MDGICVYCGELLRHVSDNICPDCAKHQKSMRSGGCGSCGGELGKSYYKVKCRYRFCGGCVSVEVVE